MALALLGVTLAIVGLANGDFTLFAFGVLAVPCGILIDLL